MDNSKTYRRIKLVTTVCVIYLLLTIFFHHIDKYLTGIIYFILLLLIPITFILMFVYLIKGIIRIVYNRKNLTFKFCLPPIIAATTLTYVLFSPYRLDSEKLESDVLLRACFEGTQNQAYLLFRQDKTFEINWTGVIFDEWFHGTYTQKADTFYLNYKTEKPYRFGDTLVKNGENIITVNKIKNDSNQYFVPFYLGYCKGLN